MDQSVLYSFYEGDPGPIVGFLAHLAESYGLGRDLDVVDMGCGPGRLLAPLAGLGWRVTAYEPDADYVAAAREKASALEGVEVCHGGFEDLRGEDAFDLIAAVNGPYSYIRTMDARRDVLRKCRRALRPGGVVFLDLSNFWWVLRHYKQPERATMRAGGADVTRTAEHELDYHRGLLTHRDRFEWLDDEGSPVVVEKVHRMALVGFSEIALFLADAGFVDVRTFNGWADREPSEVRGKKLMVAARAR